MYNYGEYRCLGLVSQRKNRKIDSENALHGEITIYLFKKQYPKNKRI